MTSIKTTLFVKKLFLGGISIGILALCVLFFWLIDRDTSSVVADSNKEANGENIDLQAQVAIPTHEEVKDDLSIKKIPEDEIRVITTSIYGDDKEKNEVEKWFSLRASPWGDAIENESVYKNYGTSVLEELSDNGDITAMHVLADRYLQEYVERGDGENGIKIHRQIFSKAATYGSTWALNQLALSLSSEAGLIQSSEQRRNMVFDSLAYLEVSERRGDKLPKITSRKFTLTEHGLSLTEHDLEDIKNRANTIYEELATKRQELGLPEFDNSVPESVSRFFARMEGD